MMPASPPMSSSALDEETARSEVYGLLALLFYAVPAPELIANLRAAATDAPTAGAFLEEPWRQFVGVAREMDDKAIQSEHHALFGGVGKPEVYLYGSHYLAGFLNEKPLAALRGVNTMKNFCGTVVVLTDRTCPEVVQPANGVPAPVQVPNAV